MTIILEGMLFFQYKEKILLSLSKYINWKNIELENHEKKKKQMGPR